jgi:acetyltransferase-like isoleucine patch superfamily enzyme
VKRLARKLNRIIDKITLRRVASFFYKECPENKNSLTLLRFAFYQKILGFNRSVPWPVHPSSNVVAWGKIKRKDWRLNPGFNTGCYIQALNGIEFGFNVYVGPNVVIVSANHDLDDYDRHTKNPPIIIGDNVWIGANSVILPGVRIGNNVAIGAGSVVNKDIPDNSIVNGNPCQVIKEKPPYQGKSYK